MRPSLKRGHTPLILVSLVAQVTRRALQPAADELRDDYPFIHWGDNVANYPYGWEKRRVELLIIDASKRFERSSLPLPRRPRSTAGGRRRTRNAAEAYLAVAATGDLTGDGRPHIVCGVTLDTRESYLLA